MGNSSTSLSAPLNQIQDITHAHTAPKSSSGQGTKEIEPAVDYVAGDGPPPCFLYFGTFLFVRTPPEEGEREQGGARASSVVSVLTYLI